MTSFREQLPGRLVALAVVCLLAGSAAAQGDRERRFLADTAAKLHRNAESWFKAGFVVRAKRIWREVVTDYDVDYEPSWNALGYLRFGTTWAPDESRPYPEADHAPPSRGRALEKKWDTLARTLAQGHRKVAVELADAGDTKRARYHARRALRFAPGDAEAGAILGYGAFDGLYGDDAELEILERSRQMRDAVAFLSKAPFAVEVLPADTAHRALDRAGVAYRGVRSAHFTVWGDLPVTQLEEAARWAERSLWLCRTIFGSRWNFLRDPVLSAQFALFREPEVWKQVLERNRDMFDDAYLKFLLENCRAAYLREGTECLYVANEYEHDRVFDTVVRTVAFDLASLSAVALKEGVGHAIVGMFFGRNLIYLIGTKGKPEGSRTVSGGDDDEEAPLLLPDLDEWQRIAMDQAWGGESASMAALPLTRADQFKIVDRVKAWSVCDYLLRRDPDLLRALDRAAEGASVAHDVTGAFSRENGGNLDALEQDWRRFWIEHTRLQQPAMSPPAAKPSAFEKTARSWLAAVNEVRLRHQVPPVGWVAWEDPATKVLARALKAAALPPADLRQLASRTLASARGKPAEVMESWLHRPGYRDALLDPDTSVFGFAESAGVSLLEVRSMARPASSMQLYPFLGRADIPTDVAVADIGPGLRQLLVDHGEPDLARIGYPITLHVRATSEDALTNIECLVRCADQKVDGLVHISDDGTDRAIDAPGLATFYPLRPFQSGAEVVAIWSWQSGGSRLELRTEFRTR